MTYIIIASIFKSNDSTEYEAVRYFRGIRAGVSTFYDAVRVLGRPSKSISSNKNQVRFKNSMYFHYKKLGIKLYAKTGKGFGLHSLKATTIEKIMRKKQYSQ